jgi:signal transduction histidine kinase
LYDERVVIIDTNRKVLYKIPDTLQVKVSLFTLQRIKAEKEYRWYSDEQYQNVGTYLENEGEIVIATGLDKPGLEKIADLKIILTLVLIGGLIVTAFISFFFVREAFMPLTKLSAQMTKTSLENLTQRLEVNETDDEVNEIARNFNAMLERLNKNYEFQKSFVYHASHELRTPLATMLSQTESALGKTMSGPEYEKLLFSLREEQQELIELTNSLLLLSQYEQLAFAQEWPYLRIDEILYEIVSQSKRTYPDLEVTITFTNLPENDNDFIIQGNESLIKSAFFNLVKNAYLYSIDQKVIINIAPGKKNIMVYIENGGPQPGPDEVEKIMVPFYRGQNALKAKGFGLGLSIIHRIITIHKGRVAYAALPGNINRFTVILAKASSDQGI